MFSSLNRVLFVVLVLAGCQEITDMERPQIKSMNENGRVLIGDSVSVSVEVIDNQSGLDYLQIECNFCIQNKRTLTFNGETTPLFLNIQQGVDLSLAKNGINNPNIQLKLFDKAGNFREETLKFSEIQFVSIDESSFKLDYPNSIVNFGERIELIWSSSSSDIGIDLFVDGVQNEITLPNFTTTSFSYINLYQGVDANAKLIVYDTLNPTLRDSIEYILRGGVEVVSINGDKNYENKIFKHNGRLLIGYESGQLVNSMDIDLSCIGFSIENTNIPNRPNPQSVELEIEQVYGLSCTLTLKDSDFRNTRTTSSSFGVIPADALAFAPLGPSSPGDTVSVLIDAIIDETFDFSIISSSTAQKFDLGSFRVKGPLKGYPVSLPTNLSSGFYFIRLQLPFDPSIYYDGGQIFVN